MLTVVTWLWKPAPGYRSQFRAEHVNVLRSMVARHYQAPHDFACVTDMPHGLHPGVRVVPAWNDFAGVPSPHGGRNPSCYRRLRAFAPDVAAQLGARFVSLDLDTVVTGDLGPVWDRPEDFVIWGETNPRSYYNGSMWLLTAGARAQVWQRFNPRTSPGEALAAGKFGSDQGWLSHCLGPGEATWTVRDGVYSFGVHLQPKAGALPADARIVMFHGSTDPWSPGAQKLDWVRREYRA
jgi:hypothetical protein